MVWPARIGVAATAVLVAAWCSVALRSSILEQEGTEAARGHPLVGLTGQQPSLRARHELSQAKRDLDRARWLNPDSRPDLGLATVFIALGEVRRGERVLQAVTRREPENIEAWKLAGFTTRDPRRSAEVLRRIRRLQPSVRGPRLAR